MPSGWSVAEWCAALQAFAAVLTAGVTIALVFITRSYARSSHEMVQEMQRARESAVWPNVVLTVRRPSTGDAGAPLPCLVNTGPGAARDLEVTFRFSPDEIEWKLRHPLIAPDDFVVSEPDNQDYRNRNIGKFGANATLEVAGTCRTVYGTEVRLSQRILLQETLDTVNKTEWQRRTRT